MNEHGKFLPESMGCAGRERRLFEGRAATGDGPTSLRVWTPAVGYREGAGRTVLAAGIAGVRRDDLSSEAQGRVPTQRVGRPPGSHVANEAG